MMEAIFLNQKTKAFVEEKKVTVKRSCRVFERKKRKCFLEKYFIFGVIVANQMVSSLI
jgi:hypothetical protein